MQVNHYQDIKNTIDLFFKDNMEEVIKTLKEIIEEDQTKIVNNYGVRIDGRINLILGSIENDDLQTLKNLSKEEFFQETVNKFICTSTTKYDYKYEGIYLSPLDLAMYKDYASEVTSFLLGIGAKTSDTLIKEKKMNMIKETFLTKSIQERQDLITNLTEDLIIKQQLSDHSR